MKKIIRNSIAIAAFTILAATPVTPGLSKTVVMQQNSPALAAGASYAWAATSTASIDPAASGLANQITAARLKSAIETTLAAHGFRKVASTGEADLTVAFHVVVDRERGARVSESPANICGFRGCLRSWSSETVVTEYDYTRGTLVIDLIDPRTGQLVWRANSEKRLSDSEVSQMRLDKRVAKMMRSLPTA